MGQTAWSHSEGHCATANGLLPTECSQVLQPDSNRVVRSVIERKGFAKMQSRQLMGETDIAVERSAQKIPADLETNPGRRDFHGGPGSYDGLWGVATYAAGLPNCSRRKASRNSLISPSNTLAGLFDRHIVRWSLTRCVGFSS